MPLEVVLLAPSVMSLDDQRELAESLNPPVTVSEENQGGAVVFRDLDDTRVLTLARAKRIDVLSDARRLLSAEAIVPEDTQFWVEGVLPFDYRRGLTIVYALEAALEGTAVVRGLEI